jgi:hypothetical protein
MQFMFHRSIQQNIVTSLCIQSRHQRVGRALRVCSKCSTQPHSTKISAAWALRLAGVNMTNMFLGNTNTLSTENYSRTLIGWANYVSANSDTPANVTLGAGNRTYNNTAYTTGETYNDAVAARAYLTGTPPTWTITDGGQV